MSSYNSPLPVGADQATGAYAIAIGDTAAGTNNVGNRTDSAGNVAPDFVWGNFPMQPNDERTDGTAVATVAANASQNYNWNGYNTYPSARLTAATSNNHTVAEAEWNNYPSFTPGVGSFMVTAATGNGTTVTYTSQNKLAVGDTVNITGLTASAYNLSSATVATADALKFTVTNAANAGEITGQWYGKVESTTALTAADGVGIGYINVPSVIGETTALALDELKDAGYEAASITTASAASNVGKTITAAARSALQLQQQQQFTQPAQTPTTQLVPRSHLLREHQLPHHQSTLQHMQLVPLQLPQLQLVRLQFLVQDLQLQIPLVSTQL